MNVQKGTVFLQSLFKTSSSISVNVSFISVGILRVGKAGHQGQNTWSIPESLYAATGLFVPKPNDRGLRLCVDYQTLNLIIVKNRCTIP
jgi:hypothetical protein